MTAVDQTPNSQSATPTGDEALLPELRADLQWCRHSAPECWIIRDPLAESFFSLDDFESCALMQMNGRRSLAAIVLEVRSRFPAAVVDHSWLNALVLRLRQHHLLVPQSAGEALLHARSKQQARRRSWQWQVLAPLSIRIPLFDPTSLLNKLQWCAAILFHRWFVRSWLLVGSVLLFMVVRELFMDGFSAAIDFRLLQGDRWLLMFACYVVAKSLHELGHALACVHHRTRCNEVGLMLLCLTPCLYCDTTDSWKLPSKWHRAQIAGAGIWVEFLLASLAAAVWLSTREGLPHDIAASMMLVCSLGTLLVNANPLLKYDGYYILSDLWGVPNLTERSREALHRIFATIFLSEPRNSPKQFDRASSPKLGWLAAYAVASSFYRMFLLGLIVWVMWQLLVPLGLGLVAAAVSMSLLVGLIVAQFRGLGILCRTLFYGNAAVRFGRVVALFVLLFVATAFVVAMPLPSFVRARAVTDFVDRQPLFANQDAELVFFAPVGGRLAEQEKLIEFSSLSSRLELIRLQREIAVIDQDLNQLRLRSAVDPSTAYQIPSRQEQLHELKKREAVLQREQAALTSYSSKPGYLLAQLDSAEKSITAPRDDRFSSHSLSDDQLGRSVERGSLVAWFSDKQKSQVLAYIPEKDVRRLQLGTPVGIRWDSALPEILSGTISRISPDPTAATPTELIGDAGLISRRNERGQFEPETAHYEVTVQVDGMVQRPRRAVATVQIHLPDRTLWERAAEYVRENLKPF